jgi:hypothetical protein
MAVCESLGGSDKKGKSPPGGGGGGAIRMCPHNVCQRAIVNVVCQLESCFWYGTCNSAVF